MGLLDGKIAIVTGAGQGVGRGIALALTREGAAVAVVGRTLEKCERTLGEIEALGGRGIALSCKVNHRNQVVGIAFRGGKSPDDALRDEFQAFLPASFLQLDA